MKELEPTQIHHTSNWTWLDLTPESKYILEDIRLHLLSYMIISEYIFNMYFI